MSRRDLMGALDALVRRVDTADSLDAVRQGVVLERARAVLRRAQAGLTTPVPWTAFAPAPRPAPTASQVTMVQTLMPHLSAVEATAFIENEAASMRLFVNSRYQVAVSDEVPLVHLSVKRIDQEPVHDWRDLQRIKDELVGPEHEAVELYPARSRVVDTANQYHLWCLPSPVAGFPFGFRAGLRVTAPGGGAHQRPLEQET